MNPYITFGLIIIIFIIVCLSLAARKAHSKGTFDIHSDNYYALVKKQLNAIEQQQLQAQKDTIQLINRLITNKNRELKYINQQAEEEIHQKVNSANRQIAHCWKLSPKNNFYYCLSLHYQSFSLADAVKMDSNMMQSMVRKSLTQNIKEISEKVTQLQNKIDAREAVREDYTRIKQLREMRKDYFSKRQYINQLIEAKENFVKIQNLETKRMKDYIRMHFGKRGREWAARIENKHKH